MRRKRSARELGQPAETDGRADAGQTNRDTNGPTLELVLEPGQTRTTKRQKGSAVSDRKNYPPIEEGFGIPPQQHAQADE